MVGKIPDSILVHACAGLKGADDDFCGGLLYKCISVLYFRGIVAQKAKSKKREENPERVAILEELKATAEKLGVKVREERLLREVGYQVRSGLCRVGDEQVFFLDRSLPVDSQIDVLIDELAERETDQVYLSPVTRNLLDLAARGGVGDNGESETRR